MPAHPHADSLSLTACGAESVPRKNFAEPDVAAARKAIVIDDLPQAIAETAHALAVYRQSVEAASRDDTIRIWDE